MKIVRKRKEENTNFRIIYYNKCEKIKSEMNKLINIHKLKLI